MFFEDSFDDESIQSSVKLTMNGITNSYMCSFEVNDNFEDKFQMSGRLGVNLSDFEIEPIKKFMGLIKVEDEVFISFNVLFSTNNKIAEN